MIKLVLALVLLLCCAPFSAQDSKTDSLLVVLKKNITLSERASTLHALSPRYINTNPDSALLLAKQAYEITNDLGDYDMHSRSFRRLGHASYVAGDWRTFKESLKTYIKVAEENDDYFQVAASYRNLSKYGEATKQPDSSLFYLDKCIEVLEEHPDSIILIDVYLSKGLSYKYKGFYESSVEALLNGLRISESMEEPYKLGYLYMNLAITYNAMDRDQESVDAIAESLIHFRNDGNDRALTRSLSNMGFGYRALGNDEEAAKYYKEAIESAQETSMDFIAMHSYVGLAEVALDNEEYAASMSHLQIAEEIARDVENTYTLGAIARFRAEIALTQGDVASARRYAKEAEKYLEAFREPIEEGETYFQMADIYEGIGQYQKSIRYLKEGHALEDSVYTLKKEQQFEELNLMYETEKKDAEIALLNKQTQLDATRKRGLWVALGLLFLLGAAIIYSLIQRKRKKEAILIQQKEAETKKLELANKELEFKKKELTAKALQLARKNEFLTSLEEEIEDLKSSVDKTVGKTSERISRMIQMDANDDDEWEQFGREFSSVHQDFLDRLKEKYGSFSKGEMRLIALLKMNMSSKDIANTLRISSDGIKKARYRLRKKMGLESDVDIQSYLIGF